jgi:hypothetical protein
MEVLELVCQGKGGLPKGVLHFTISHDCHERVFDFFLTHGARSKCVAPPHKPTVPLRAFCPPRFLHNRPARAPSIAKLYRLSL